MIRYRQCFQRYLFVRNYSQSQSLNQFVDYSVGFMFPGQGAQYVGMGKQLAAEVPAAKVLFDTASNIIGIDLLEICSNGPKDLLDKTAIAQVAIFVSSMAALEKCFNPGEYTALCFAGAISFEDGVRITKIRGDSMQKASDARKSGMVALVGMNMDNVIKLCQDVQFQCNGDVISVANILAPGNIVVAGTIEACNLIRKLAPRRSAFPLSVAGAFHTSLMQPAVNELQTALESIPISPLRIPVISNVTAAPHGDAKSIRELLVRQVTTPVQWQQTMIQMLGSNNHKECYEFGPGNACAGIVKKFESSLNKQFHVMTFSA